MKQVVKFELKNFSLKLSLRLLIVPLVSLSLVTNISASDDGEMEAVGAAARDILARDAARAAEARVAGSPEGVPMPRLLCRQSSVATDAVPAGPRTLRRELTLGIVSEASGDYVGQMPSPEARICALETALDEMMLSGRHELSGRISAEVTLRSIQVRRQWQQAIAKVLLANSKKNSNQKLATAKLETLRTQARLAEADRMVAMLQQELAKTCYACTCTRSAVDRAAAGTVECGTATDGGSGDGATSNGAGVDTLSIDKR